MSGANLGPVPTRLVLLPDLPAIAVGEKVRFLGWLVIRSHRRGRGSVADYSTSRASLDVGYGAATTKVSVDVGLLLSTLDRTNMEVGAWINIIGYICVVPEVTTQSKKTRPAGETVYVQAIMIWSAGAIDVGEYERVLRQRESVEG
ncbi:MAG: hypothetical protein M4579_005188 [Chaenotheca gracillima]|nr:MAG: hypothetical protein M4579_005188 [Chaenotheca gracillima]